MPWPRGRSSGKAPKTIARRASARIRLIQALAGRARTYAFVGRISMFQC